MEHLLRIALAFALIFVISGVYYVVRGRWRATHAADVELGFGRVECDFSALEVFGIWAPFYDRSNKLEVGLHRRGLLLGFTPITFMADVVQQTLGEYCLAQVVVDSRFLPDREYIHKVGLRPFQDGVIYHDGALLYGPDALRRGGLKNGLTLGTDLFLLIKGDLSVARARIADLRRLVGPSAAEEDYHAAFGQTGIDACLANRHETWYLFHRDAELRDRLANAVMSASYRDLLSLNHREPGWVGAFPSYDSLVAPFFEASGREVRLQLYFEEGDVVTYLRSGKKWKAVVTPEPPALITYGRASQLARFLSWVVPQIVADRAYRRKSLFRFSLQYFLTIWYLMGAVAILIGLSNSLLTAVPDIWFGVPCAILGFLALLSLILSFSYLIRAIFGGRRLLRPGI